MSSTVATDQIPVVPGESSDSDSDTDTDRRHSEVVLGGNPRRYLSLRWKCVLSLTFSLAWLGLSMWISLPWVGGLAGVIAVGPAIVIVSLLAFVPGLIIAFLVAGLALDRQPPFKVTSPTEALTVVIAARNEQGSIRETLQHLVDQDYDGPFRVVLADNGSSDATVEVAITAAEAFGLDLKVVSEPIPGKSNALNRGLAEVTTALVVTVDADTLLHPSALRFLVARLASSPSDVEVVAGCVLVRNSRNSIWTRLQEWDYFLGIASVKRMQGLFQSTLVAQGAFSLYRTDAIKQAGGWPDAIGEDIVLTWEMLRNGVRVCFEPLAVAFTGAPEGFTGLARQRSRWARGMIEGLRSVPPWRQKRSPARLLTAIDLAIPLLDAAYVFLWIPGIVLACFGCFWVVGPMTLAVVPLTLAVYAMLFHYQRRRVFEPLGLHVRRNILGFFFFLIFYQLFMSIFSMVGYIEEFSGRAHRWK